VSLFFDRTWVSDCDGSRILRGEVTHFSGDVGRGFCVTEDGKRRTECGFLVVSVGSCST
jgi:hypothetical protein